MMCAYWLWYPGDFEAYHALKQNFSRVERGYGWPAFWKSAGFRNRVAFRRTYALTEPTTFRVRSRDAGFVMAGEAKYPFGAEVSVPAGEIMLSIHCGRYRVPVLIHLVQDDCAFHFIHHRHHDGLIRVARYHKRHIRRKSVTLRRFQLP